uniref:Disease resistance R13L4/SHOC-2-like LRR domain-containing protein n=1 Tax=Quercus lobata TaxID=97700 RepID=A0A7N2M8K4_QUELO
MLNGTIPSNASTLFLLPHLQHLNLAFNDFNYSQISSGFGRFAKLRYLNLSRSNFDGEVPLELSHLSQLASLDLSSNDDDLPSIFVETSVVKRLVQNLTKLRELHLDHVDMSSVSLTSFMNFSSSLASLSLEDCELRGSPADLDIFGLQNLHELNLGGNSLSGEIPSSFSNIKALSYLDLGWNNLNGPIPTLFGNLTKVTKIFLYNNDFTGQIPSSLSNLKDLNVIDLSNNKFEGSIPVSLGNLTKVTDFMLQYNNFTGHIPSSLSHLKVLNLIDLSYNKFEGSIPVSFGNLTKVTDIMLQYNNFTGQIPSSLSNLKYLNVIDLSYNKFEGSIPVSLGKLTKVTEIMLQYNNFTGHIPSSLSNLKDLTFIDFSHNNFVGFGGKIPFLTNLTKLTAVDLSYNQLTSQMCEFQRNNSLQTLRLENNRLYGSILNSISNLVNLRELHLSSNDLSGIVEFDKSTNLKELHTLDLSNNSLFLGIKSNSNHTFPHLRKLNMSSCNIIEFPNFLKSSKYLDYLDLSNNRIPNQIPEWMLEVVENLHFLDLHANLLQGNLPVPPSTMIAFFMSNNRLTGEIPSMICNASNLEILDISNNNLSGKIPQCLGNFGHRLSVMDLRTNNFHGPIPDTFEKDNSLATIAFNGNHLEGKLPKSFVNCTNLEALDLGNNKINDSFPYWLEALSELRLLVLSNNRFHGPIRNHKNKGVFFSKLQILDLSHNEFTGLLPRIYFENLEALMICNENAQDPQYLAQDYGKRHGSEYDKHKIENPTSLYQNSIEVTVKGLKIKLLRVLTIFTTIDLSSNQFQGVIPDALGRLKVLRLLNLSHNSLTGHIPSTLGNLLKLEALDLSSNKLTGEIPMQLTLLTFLAMLNLSQNYLIGHIPQGKQFNTFGNESYDGNLGLCGSPLSIKCSTNEPPPTIFLEDNDSMFAEGFGWKTVLIGYGCGFVFGLVVGYVVFKARKPQWIIRLIEGEREGRVTGRINQRPKRRRS